jgi:hypothetical protein
MLFRRILELKYAFYAILSLAAFVGAAEVGLRLYESYMQQTEVVAVAGPQLSTASPTTFYQMEAHARLRFRNPDSGAEVEISTNSFGLRGKEPSIPKPADVYRIVCLGDETVLGPDVAESETVSARLQEFLQPHTSRKVEVVNAGVPGFCPLLSLLQIRHSLAALEPDLLVLSFDLGDVADDHQVRRYVMTDAEGNPLSCPHSSLAGESKKVASESPLNKYRVLAWCKKQLGMLPLERNRPEDERDVDSRAGRYAWLQDDPPDWSVYVTQTFSAIDGLDRHVRGGEAQLIVAGYPVAWQVSATACNEEVRRRLGIARGEVCRSRFPFEVMETYLEQRSISFCNATPVFEGADRPERFFLNGAPRFTSEGHRLYARVLGDFIMATVPRFSTRKNSVRVQDDLSRRAGESPR